MTKNKQRNLIELSSHFLFFIVAEGIFAAIWLLLIPKEAGNADFLGYSFRRLALLVPILGFAVLAGILRLLLNQREDWQAALENTSKRMDLARKSIIAGFLLALTCWSFAFFFHFLRFFEDIGAYVRLLPILVYIFAIGLESILFTAFIWLGGQKKAAGWKFKSLFGRTFWVALSILLVTWLVIEVTGIGKNPEFVSIISLGVPLLEGQIWYLAGLIILVLCLAGAWSRLPQTVRKPHKINPDFLICLALWAVAVLLWMSLPLPRHNYFAPQTLPPNNAIYPFSDAEQYDMNSIWVWKGSIKDIVISKPLYIVFLAALHAIVGLDYGKLILLQTLLLALLPAVLYLIGKEMHSRLGGFILGLLVILREMNSIQAINVANVSNSKLLLSDLPATLLVCILVLVMIRWFKSAEDKVGLPPFVAGGMIACLILMRIQSLILVPLFILLVIIRYRKHFKKMLQAGILLLLALLLVLAPVLIRNHAITNVYWVDNPSNYALYEWLLRGSDVEMDVPSSGTPEEMMDVNVQVVSTIISSNLWGYSYHVVDNFMHNTISTILILPIRLGNQVEFLDFLKIRDPFWSEVYSQNNFWNALVVIFNLLMISIGIASVNRRHRPTLLLVILFYVVYSLSSAVVRLSGWRYILPVDWLVMAFYIFGLIDCLRWMVARFMGWNGFADQDWLATCETQAATGNLTWKPVLVLGLVFVLAGASISIRENLFPADYPDYTREEVCTTIQSALVDSQWQDQSAELYQFCMQENVRAYKGIGIYPRFFKSGTGFYNRSYDPYFGEQDYGRLVFRTVGNPNSKVYIKTDDENIRFADGTEVYVVGKDQTKFEARVILINGDQPQIIVSSTDLEIQ